MKARKALPAAALVLLWSATATAQDPLKVDPGHYKVIVENASVRVLRVTYPAGGKSPMHQHPDSIVIPLASAKVRFATPDGKSEDRDMASETATYMPAGTHSNTNMGGLVDAILVEFKAAAPGNATIPTSRENMALKVLAEGPRALAYRVTADPTFQEPAGSKHDYDQIVIALGPTQMTLAVDGKPAKSSWVRGDVQFIERGTGHASKNAGGKPTDFVIVAVK